MALVQSECCQLFLRTRCRKEDINLRFVGVTEHDYEWLTAQIVEVANRWVAEGEKGMREGRVQKWV